MSYIPVIDFEEFSPEFDSFVDCEADYIKDLGGKLKTAFESVGFCYIKNHGIDEDLVKKYFEVSEEFFTLPAETKQKYSRELSKESFGWVALETERLALDRPADIRECFNFNPGNDNGNWEPGENVFRETSYRFIEECVKLSHRILKVVAVGLGLDYEFLSKAHTRLGKKGNMTCLRSLYYPPITDDSSIKPGQIRLGEHADYGSLTILFQDNIGGLEIEIPGVGFVPATPIPGTAVVNVGNLMQRWTADQLIATKHRVLIPEEEMVKRSCRQSAGFFIHPDDDVMITCLDGSNKYEPITAFDYVNNKLKEMYSQ